jgi:GntR family transcriptional regulator / MocR family aminotransferase
MELSILIEGGKHLSEQVYQAIRSAVLDGRLSVNERVPASRELAEQLNISRNTVLAAYERLTSEGYLQSHLGSGTFVDQGFRSATSHKDCAAHFEAPSLSALGRRVHEPTAIVPRRDLPFDFRPGVPDLKHLPVSTWRRISSRQISRLSAKTAYYGDAAGDPSLREAIARHFGRTRALHCNPDDIVIVNGTQQSLDILGRLLIEPGDVVAVEDPGYPGALAAFRALGAHIIPVPVDRDGLCTSRLPPRAKLVYVTPSHQFPLGIPMSLARRRELLAWAKENSALVVEDDYDSEFRYEGRPLDALQGLDKAGQVVYLGTFSKVLFPSLRLGFIVLPNWLFPKFLSLKWLTDRHTETLEQHVLAQFIKDGHFGRHIRRMQKIYADRRNALLAAINQWLPFIEPLPSIAGLHLSAFLPKDFPAEDLISRAAAGGVGLYSIAPFYQEESKGGLIFGFGSCELDHISEGVRRVGNICKAMDSMAQSKTPPDNREQV